MKSKNGFVHDTSQQEHLVNFLCLGNSPEFIVESDSDLCFKEFFLLFSGWHVFSVSKLIDIVKFLNVVFDMHF